MPQGRRILIGRVARHAGQEGRRVPLRTLHVPPRIVEKVALGHAHGNAVRVLDHERQIHGLARCGHFCSIRRRIYRLPAVLQRIAAAAAVSGVNRGVRVRKLYSGGLRHDLYPSRKRGLETICHAVVACNERNAPASLEPHDGLIRTLRHQRLFVEKRTDTAADCMGIARKHLGGGSAKQAHALDLHGDWRRGDSLNART